MIILITGASHTGKTLLAQRLLEACHAPYLSIDHLKMGLIRSGNTALTPEDDDALTEYLWPIVREMVKTAIENRQHLIVEGCYIPFDWRKDFEEDYLSHIRFLCLAMTEPYIDAHFEKIKAHASDIESRLDDSELSVEGVKVENRRYLEGFQRAGEQVVLIDTDYETAIRAALEEVTDDRIQIKKMETDDEIRGKAYVHWKAWHEAYPGLVDQGYLDALTLEKCEAMAYRWTDGLFVAKDHGRVIGFVGTGDRGDEAPDNGEIFALYVLAEYYGKGVAQQLMAAGLEHLKQYPQICLWALKENKRAIRFYEKCGFVPTGEELTSPRLGAAEIRMVLKRER